MMATKTRRIEINFIGYDKQVAVLNSQAGTIAMQGGAGCGKSLTGCVWALKHAAGNPGSRGMIIADSHPQLEQSVLPHLLNIATRSGLDKQWTFNQSTKRVTFPNGSYFWLRSADRPESLLGADLSWIWGDEVGLWKRNAWRFAISRLRQPGYKHQILATFTPKGRTHWTFKRFGVPRAGTDVYHCTSAENVYLGVDHVERMRDDYGEGSLFWQQEALGEYVQYEGLVYPTFDPAQHVKKLPSKIQFKFALGAVDWGWANPGVMLALGVEHDGTVWVLDETYETHWPIEMWQERGRNYRATHRARTFVCDPSEPQNIAKLIEAGLDAVGAENAIIPGIARVNGLLMNGKLFLTPGCVNTIREMEEYKWKVDSQQEQRADEPEGKGDHAMDALRYGVMEAKKTTASYFGT
jgi:phage terminase large subunit